MVRKRIWAALLPIMMLLFLVGTIVIPVQGGTLRLATTTSTEDSGLLDLLLPQFTEETGLIVEVIAVGTGQALAIGRRGDADILLVHAPALEAEFVAEGYGTERFYVMYNDLVIVGPVDDVAGLLEVQELGEALVSIYESGEAGKIRFASRGDESGTHTKEKNLWGEDLSVIEDGDWYLSLGQGMGPTLITANEMRAYTLTDRGTYLSMQDVLKNLEILFEGDDLLFNPYGMIPLNDERFSHVNYEGAQALVDFFLCSDIREQIGEFGKEEFGQSLFFPSPLEDEN